LIKNDQKSSLSLEDLPVRLFRFTSKWFEIDQEFRFMAFFGTNNANLVQACNFPAGLVEFCPLFGV
jgi:hypothetical protein